MARNKEYDREEVLNTATQIFWKKGYKGTSVSDLISATSLGKRSLYQEFGNKEQLFSECIEYYFLNLSKETANILTEEPLGLRNIEIFFENRIRHASTWDSLGCMIINSVIEKELIDQKSFDRTKKYISTQENTLFKCLKVAQENGEISQSKDCRVLAGLLNTFVCGMMVIGKTGPSQESLAAQVEVIFTAIKK